MNLNDTNIIFLHHDAGSGGDTIATILEDNELFETTYTFTLNKNGRTVTQYKSYYNDILFNKIGNGQIIKTPVDFYWHDKHTENLFAKGFEFRESDQNPVELLTCFETFEHFVEPAIELENLLNISQNILLSTEFIPDPVPSPDEWWYYGSEHGQHIGFFQKKTFEYLANKHSLYFYTNGQNIHLFTKKRLLKPAFKWLTKASKYINPLIQKRMDSSTWKDFETLKSEI